MIYCSRCGNKNEQNTKYCSKCGNRLEINEIQENINVPIQKKEGLATASLIIGIISLVFSFVLNIFILPLAIIGLILGIVNKIKKGKKFAGIILNAVAIIVSIIMIIIIIPIFFKEANGVLNSVYNKLDYMTSDDYISGTWDCKNFSSSSSIISDEYIVTMELNKDNSFIWNKYGDKENNHLFGTYTFEDEEKTNNSGNYRYFMINSEISEYVSDGVSQELSTNRTMQYEFGITSVDGKKQGILMNTSTYNMYYCYEN